MSRTIYQSEVTKLKVQRHRLLVIIFILALLNIGQAIYAYYIVPSQSEIAILKQKLERKNEKITDLKYQLQEKEGLNDELK
ncbi:hypothetical protein ABVC54_01025 [Lactobacillus gasseri]|uniref:hypothetical protein n=1 Tax=Lactobacillus TaxID=1578 RepID=UPI001194182D|nr:hypothetical protein [Lactobacillus jensenii]MDK7308806.1 hypothetical protein [Lactobacillus jensenii]MDK7318278.1 hypothetical protein [Lactobacillus jensenii]TVV11521.1 hypothetical protein FOF67_02230 [Lactobacillus jensenii]TVV22622.1 hypothetical protein FOF69_00685 [Lactobacillus jensenii]